MTERLVKCVNNECPESGYWYSDAGLDAAVCEVCGSRLLTSERETDAIRRYMSAAGDPFAGQHGHMQSVMNPGAAGSSLDRAAVYIEREFGGRERLARRACKGRCNNLECGKWNITRHLIIGDSEHCPGCGHLLQTEAYKDSAEMNEGRSMAKEDGGTGYAVADDPNYRYRGEAAVDARDINSMVHQTQRAMEFYMHLHRDKGGWQDYRRDYCWESILRNLHEAYKEDRKVAVMEERGEFADDGYTEAADARREAVAELVGIINHVAILLDIFYKPEMEALIDWLPTRDAILNKDKDGRD